VKSRNALHFEKGEGTFAQPHEAEVEIQNGILPLSGRLKILQISQGLPADFPLRHSV
jgi:hypothetical protein